MTEPFNLGRWIYCSKMPYAYLSIILLVKGKIIADFSQWGDPLFALLPDAPASCFLLWLGFKI